MIKSINLYKRWMKFLPFFIGFILIWTFWTQAGDDPAAPLFQEDFEKTDPGGLPKGFLVLEGDFAVFELFGNRVLRLPAFPLGDFGVLFGPSETEGRVRVRVRAEAKKRLFPRFGVGLNGVSGYRLWVTPARKRLELIKGEEVLATHPFAWKSGEVCHLSLQIRRRTSGWSIEAEAWMEGDPPPADSMIIYQTDEEPVAGKASIWGAPYSEYHIDFDDLVLDSGNH